MIHLEYIYSLVDSLLLGFSVCSVKASLEINLTKDVSFSLRLMYMLCMRYVCIPEKKEEGVVCIVECTKLTERV